MRIVLFDLYHGGHHGQYLATLANNWLESNRRGELHIVVHERALSTESRIRDLLAQTSDRLHVRGVSTRFDLQQGRRFQLPRNDREHGRVLREIIQEITPDHCVLMYFDHMQLSLSLDLRLQEHVELSGIYFRPSFHYGEFEGDRPSAQERLRRLRKRVALRGALRNPHFKYLFCLDPYVIPHLPTRKTGARGVALPDGVPPFESDSISTREIYEGVEPGRVVASLFGVLDARKGVYELLESLPLLPAETQRSLALVLAGPIREGRESLLSAVEIARSTSAVQVVLDDRFLDEADMARVLRSSTLVLVPYRDHVGSSNVMIRAARADRPVLGPNYGLMGKQIREWKLGVTAETSNPAEIANALHRLFIDPDSCFDRNRAHAFAELNSDENFARTVFDTIYGSSL